MTQPRIPELQFLEIFPQPNWIRLQRPRDTAWQLQDSANTVIDPYDIETVECITLMLPRRDWESIVLKLQAHYGPGADNRSVELAWRNYHLLLQLAQNADRS